MATLAHLIEQHGEDLLQRFVEEARQLPSACDIPLEDILDNFPEYLAALAALSRSGHRGEPAQLKRRLAQVHTSQRLRLGYSLDEVTAEYVLLGRLLSQLWEPLPPEEQPAPSDIQLLFDELQATIEHTVTVFHGYSLNDLQAERRALRRMDALAADLLSSTEPSVPWSERLAQLLRVLQEALQADAATLLLAEPDGPRLVPTASSGRWPTPPDPEPVSLATPSFVAQVASSTVLLHVPDAATSAHPLPEGVRVGGIHSLLGLRMWPRGRLLGVVYLGLAGARPVEPRLHHFFETLVVHLAGIVDQARLLQELRHAHARQREHLNLDEERLHLAVESSGLGTWDYNPLTGEIHWDERAKALFGIPAEAQVDYDTFLATVHPEDRQRVHRLVQQTLDVSGSGTYRAEYRIGGNREGLERWISAHGRVFFDESGRAVRFIGTALDITGRVREHQAAEREKLRAIHILENISDAFLAFDREWRITYANREAERQLGQPREALLGRSHWELFPTTRGTPLEHHYRRAVAERVSLAFENYYPPWDRWFEIRAYPTEEGLAVYFHDITERKHADEERERLLREQTHLREQAEKALRERQRAIEVLEHGDALFVLDKDFRFVLVNENQERLSHTRREDTLGRVFWEVFPTTATPELKYWREYHRVVEEKVPIRFDEYYAPLDLWTGVSAYPTSEGGLAVFFRDVTEQKRAEQFRDRLVGIVSHDLRNPLHSITLAAQLLLRREGIPESVMVGVQRIVKSTDRMSRMITDLLDFTRARVGGGIPLQRQRISLVELVRATLEEFEVMYPGRVFFTHGRGPYTGEWDPDRLAQVVSNLVGNALQHGAEGQPVELSLRQEDTQSILAVHNQGMPIPESLLPHLFDPFRRAADDGRSSGLGLGLYIVQQIVLAHGGSIAVHSTGAEGTTFTVRLPS